MAGWPTPHMHPPAQPPSPSAAAAPRSRLAGFDLAAVARGTSDSGASQRMSPDSEPPLDGSDPTGAAGVRSRRDVCCQVPGCGTDLSDASCYLRRYRVCMVHQRAAMVELADGEHRFCQQCGRFQLLEDFDANKRSCRERLSRHNARRRKGLDDATGAASSEQAPSSDPIDAAADKPVTAGKRPSSSGGAAATPRVRAGRVAKRVGGGSVAADRSTSLSGPTSSASLTASASDATFQPSGSEASSAATSDSTAPSAPTASAAPRRRSLRATAAARPPLHSGGSRGAPPRSPSGSPQSKTRPVTAILQLRRSPPGVAAAADADAAMEDAGPYHPALTALTTAGPVAPQAALSGSLGIPSDSLPAMSASLGSGPLPQFAAECASPSVAATAAAAAAPVPVPTVSADPPAPVAASLLPDPFAAWQPAAAPDEAAAAMACCAMPQAACEAPGGSAAPAQPMLEALGLLALPSLPSGVFGGDLSGPTDLAMVLRALDDEDDDLGGADAVGAPTLCAVPSASPASTAAAAAAAAACALETPTAMDMSVALPVLMPQPRTMLSLPGSACALSDAPTACGFAPFGTLPGQPRPIPLRPVAAILADQVLDSIVDNWAAAMEQDCTASTMAASTRASSLPCNPAIAASWAPQRAPPPLPGASGPLQMPTAWQQAGPPMQTQTQWPTSSWSTPMLPAQKPQQLFVRVGSMPPAAPIAPTASVRVFTAQDLYGAGAGAGLPVPRFGMTHGSAAAATGYFPQ